MSSKGYPLPDDIDPGAFKCIRVYVPEDTLYLAAFWHAYNFFTTWLAWERDEAHRGAQAAAVWREAFEMSRSEYEDSIDCEATVYELRDDPDNPCKVQQSLDGGETWIHAFNKECAEETTIPEPPPIAYDKAGNFIYNLYVHIFEELNTGGHTEEEFGDWFCDYLTTMGVTGALITGCNSLGEGLWRDWDTTTVIERNELLDPCTHKPHFDEIKSCFDNAGLMDWLNCASDTLGEWLNQASENLMIDLNTMWGFLTGASAQSVADYEQPGGGAGFGGECAGGPFGCVDFKITADNFVRQSAYGEWINGIGWKGGQRADTGWEMDIAKAGGFPAGAPSQVRVFWSPTGNGKRIRVWINGVLEWDQSGGSAGWRQAIIPYTTAVTSLRIRVEQNNLNGDLKILGYCIDE